MFKIICNGVIVIEEAIYDVNEGLFAFKAEDISKNGRDFVFKVIKIIDLQKNIVIFQVSKDKIGSLRTGRGQLERHMFVLKHQDLIDVPIFQGLLHILERWMCCAYSTQRNRGYHSDSQI